MSTPVYSEFIMPICVPDIQVENMIVPDLELKVSGFGDTGLIFFKFDCVDSTLLSQFFKRKMKRIDPMETFLLLRN